VVLKQATLRPSNLPKLALCSWFRSSEIPNEAATRGTTVDKIFRQIVTGLADFPDGTPEEIAAADWAACQVAQIAGNHPVLAHKKHCVVRIPGFPIPGEVDALSPKAFLSFDLKTGQFYDYELQMAAYAWGLMEKFFAETWTTWILFCDLRRVHRYTFDYKSARRLVLEVRERYAAAPPPEFNSYCSWCANAGECPVLINRADEALALTEKPKFDFAGVLASPQRLGAFLTACRAVQPYQQQAADRAKEYLLAKSDVPGWRPGDTWPEQICRAFKPRPARGQNWCRSDPSGIRQPFGSQVREALRGSRLTSRFRSDQIRRRNNLPSRDS
jgi:hypothetical protein